MSSCQDNGCLEALEGDHINIYAVRFCMSVIDDETCSLAIHDTHKCLDTLTTLVFVPHVIQHVCR